MTFNDGVALQNHASSFYHRLKKSDADLQYANDTN